MVFHAGVWKKKHCWERKMRSIPASMLGVRVGWWVFWWMVGSSIILIFKYVNKQDVFISKRGIKGTYVFWIESYEHFNFKKSKI